jgi:streptogramin lyase
LGVIYTAGLSNAQGMAIDGSGNVWIANGGTAPNTSSITELSSNGTILSGASGYTGGGMSFAYGIAIDPSGNAWVTAYGNSNVIKLSSSGVILSGPNGFTGGGLSFPLNIAIDGAGNAWVTDNNSRSVIKLSNSGAILSGAGGFTAGASPGSIAIDSANNAWIASASDSIIAELSNSGAVLLEENGYYSGQPPRPAGVSLDASGNIWFVNASGGSVFELNSSGSRLSPSTGYVSCVSPYIPTRPGHVCDPTYLFNQSAIDGSGNLWLQSFIDYIDIHGNVSSRSFGLAELNSSGTIISGPTGYVPTGSTAIVSSIVIDGSGNVWTDGVNSVTELIGAATPVVTPFSLGVKNGTLGSRP